MLHASLNSTSALDILQNTEFNAGGFPHEIFTCLKGYAVPLMAQRSYFNFLELYTFHATNADHTEASHKVKFLYVKRRFDEIKKQGDNRHVHTVSPN